MYNYIDKNSVTINDEVDDKYQTVLFLPNSHERIAEGGLRTKGYFKHSIPGKPLVTIVTVVLNDEKCIEQTILSVLGQDYDNIEYLIIDGGSTDKTLEIIKKYEDSVDYWVSEKDKGTSDAINKGISLAIGYIIGFINSDDWYEKDAVLEAVAGFEANKDGMVICGRLRMADGPKKGYIYTSMPDDLCKDTTVDTPAVFFRKSVFKRYGILNMEYKIVNDYELFLRLYVNRVKFITVDKVTTNMRSGGMSQKNWLKSFVEVRKAQIEITRRPVYATVLFIYKVFRFSVKSLLEKEIPSLVLFYRKYFSRYYREYKG